MNAIDNIIQEGNWVYYLLHVGLDSFDFGQTNVVDDLGRVLLRWGVELQALQKNISIEIMNVNKTDW